MLKRLIGVLTALLFLLFSGCMVEIKESEGTPNTSDYLQMITLTVAGVGLHLPDEAESDRALLQAFEKDSRIRISVIRSAHLSVESDYLSYLSLLERSVGLPDVLIVPSLSEIGQKSILIDLWKYVASDSDYLKIPKPLREAVSYGAGVFGIPLRYYLEGYFAHLPSFSEEKVTPPSYGMSFTRFFSDVQALAKQKKGRSPLRQFYEIPFWYPAIQKENPTVWGGYDGESFCLSHPQLKNGVSYAAQLRESCYPDAEAEQLPNETTASLHSRWRSGNLPLYYGSTRELAVLAEGGTPFSFIGIPSGKALLDADYIGITESCIYKEEAFRLIKWLSYDEEGLRLRYGDSAAFLYGSPPLDGDSGRIKRFLEQNRYDGIQEAVEGIETGIVKGDDYIPAYHTYMNQLTYHLPTVSEREQTATEWIQAAVDGKYSYYRHADSLNELVNWKRTVLS